MSISSSWLIVVVVEVPPVPGRPRKCLCGGMSGQQTFIASSDALLQQLTAGHSTTFSRPQEIGVFSFDAQRNLTLDRAQLV